MWFEAQPNYFVWGPGGGDPDADPIEIADVSYQDLTGSVYGLAPVRQHRSEVQKGLKRASAVLRTNEAAAYLAISPWTLRNLVHDKRLSFIPGKYWRFAVADLDKFLEKEKVTS
jgi:excisionase family DNA binding protein